MELEFGSRLEDVLNGKGEVEERDGKEKDDDSDDSEVEDNRPMNSTNESR